MINRITHISLMVTDQNEALAFYTEKMGLDLHTDLMFGEEGQKMRWLTVCPKNQRDFEIALMPAMTPEQRSVVGKQAPELPYFCVSTDDCRATYAQLKENGVACISDPQDMPWGVSALVKDLYGNTINLVETK